MKKILLSGLLAIVLAGSASAQTKKTAVKKNITQTSAATAPVSEARLAAKLAKERAAATPARVATPARYRVVSTPAAENLVPVQ